MARNHEPCVPAFERLVAVRVGHTEQEVTAVFIDFTYFHPLKGFGSLLEEGSYSVDWGLWRSLTYCNAI